jgi:hypothetical protein
MFSSLQQLTPFQLLTNISTMPNDSTPDASDNGDTPLFDENTTPQSLRRVCTSFLYLVMV